MAAYAAVVSLGQTIEQILHSPRPRNWIFSSSPASLHLESLSDSVIFLQDFLEHYYSQANEKIAVLETKIVRAVHAAEDIIESHVVDQISGRESSTPFFEDMQKVELEICSVKEEVMQVEKDGAQQQPRNYVSSVSSSRHAPVGTTPMVGYDEELIQILDRLTGQRPSHHEVVLVTGMGGIGKTTLARNVYENPVILHHFHLRLWCTVSQNYSRREILLSLLRDFESQSSQRVCSIDEKQDHVLGERLYKILSGRRYLIVMDDIWSISVWDQIKLFLPENYNGSRIMVTTRQLNLVTLFGCSSPYQMKLLDENQSWTLLRDRVFAPEDCPQELEKVGKKIAESCKGLPLAIVVIAGILAKSKRTTEFWEYVARHVNSLANLENDENCMKILHLSYSYLPVHLKPCFLYMGVFPEDYSITVKRIIRLWMAEGFLKPCKPKSLEEVAEGYLHDLIDRSLVLVRARGIRGKVKSCGIHDFLRDLCLREAHRENFLCITTNYGREVPKCIEKQRRLCTHQQHMGACFRSFEVLDVPPLAPLARSIVSNFSEWYIALEIARGCRLLRVLDVNEQYTFSSLFNELVNLRHLSFRNTSYYGHFRFNHPISSFWNLQTLVFTEFSWDSWEKPVYLPSDIWDMPQLKHVEIKNIVLPDIPSHSHVLENLQTLLTLINFICGWEIVKRIPNIRKLGIAYDDSSVFFRMGLGWKHHSLNNLICFDKLESLSLKMALSCPKIILGEDIAFPPSLKKLRLSGTQNPWSCMRVIGALPNLEVLKLEPFAFMGDEWILNEGEFQELKYLRISSLTLNQWRADSIHFPRLEYLVLNGSYNLQEIPSGFGDIPTLRLIQLESCNESAVESAMKIKEEQEDLGNDGLQVKIIKSSDN